MTKQTIKQYEAKINQLQAEIDRLKNTSEWLDIPELGMSVELKVHNKGKSWNDLKLSDKKDQLLTLQECIFLANHPEYSKLLKMDGSSSNDDFFIQQPFKLNKKNNRVARFVVDSGGVDLYCIGVPSGSGSSLGVRFVRRKKVGEEK